MTIGAPELPGQTWGAPFNHDNASTRNFNAIHMALIPDGPYRGQVLVWDNRPSPPALPPPPQDPPSWLQYWAIVAPLAQPMPTFLNGILTIHHPNEGNLFCAGHAWNKNGQLFVAGGTAGYGPFRGARLAYIFDPNPLVGPPSWQRMPDMFQNRWYPTVTTLANDESMVSGGFNVPPVSERQNYEVASTTGIFSWRQFAGNPNVVLLTSDRVLNGPTFPMVQNIQPGRFHSYPRLFVVPEVEGDGVFLASPMNQASMLHAIGDTWKMMDFWRNAVDENYPCVPLATCSPSYTTSCLPDTAASVATFRRDDGSAVLYSLGPGSFAVALIGGTLKDERIDQGICSYREVSRSVEYCTPKSNPGLPPFGHTWAPIAPLNIPRSYLNAVLLPDGSVLVVGGVDCGPYHSPSCPPPPPPPQCLPVLPAERFANGMWTIPTATPSCPASTRDYHSTALLLPDGSILSAGGENRTWDYQIYRPAYLTDPTAQPTGVVPSQTTMSYAAQYNATFVPPANGAQVQKAVLMRPGSVTHSFDGDQRHVELVTNIDPMTPGLVIFYTPTDPRQAPRGYYMLFLVTSAGVPSNVASWIRLQ